MKNHKIKGLMLCLLGIATVFGMASCQEADTTGYTKDYTAKGSNADKSFHIVGNWTKTGIGTHFACGADPGPVGMYTIEGCMQYARDTKYFSYLIAEKFIHGDESQTDDVENGTSVIKIRDNAYWHDGGKVTAMDILSYYALCYTSLTTYVSDMYVVDDNQNGDLSDDLTLKIVWKSWKEPTDYAKNVLLAQDTKNCTIQYSKFKAFVDASLDLIRNGENGTPNPAVTKNDDGVGEERLGRHTAGVSGSLGSIYNNFRATVLKPDGAYDGYYYCGTGPFKVQSVTENQLILVKNEKYYKANNVGFDKIVCTQYSNSNMMFADLQNGNLDFVDGCYDKQLNETILAGNPSLVSYKVYDQGGIGIYFNLEKNIWDDDKVRLAFQYLFDRKSIADTANPYGKVSFRPMMVMSPVEARQYLDSDVYDMISNYSFDQEKAAELLTEAGWTKSNGKWHDKSGAEVSLTLGYQNVQPFSTIGQMAKAEAENFGISLILKSGNDMTTWFSTASASNSIYDLVAASTELNSFGTHPGGSMKHFFEMVQCGVLHLPIDKDGHYGTRVDLLSPDDHTVSLGKVRAYDLYAKIYCCDDATLKQYSDSIVLGMSKYNYGIQFYENVSGSYFNLDRIGGLPSPERFKVDRNITFIPEYTDKEYAEYVYINNGFSQAIGIVDGFFYAR
ncbi:MAG: ABC transporter substrate-binding protein [Bacilli bacterium]|jgi:peptide/nickel transport system substrate-binding protein|nr:ABC transporter substrate-binding protein [Bacilli bacterium]